MADCKHEYTWRLADCNEEGWTCMYCGHKPGEPAGFCPTLDRGRILDKVEAICFDLSEADFLYFSNADHGHGVAAAVADRCREIGLYDQYTICRLIFETFESRAEYWREVSDGVVSGNDPRDRCPCGALSTRIRFFGGETIHRCGAHWTELDPMSEEEIRNG